MKTMLVVFIFACYCLQGTNALVKIISPSGLSAKYSNITISLARFGDIDYRKQEEFDIYLPPESFEDGCQFMEPLKISAGKKVALLFSRGNCSFSRKASVALKAGADLAIVHKLQNDIASDSFIPVADGKNTKFLTPLFVVSNEVGLAMKNSILQNNKVLMFVDFDTHIQSAEPEVNFWLYTGSRSAYAKLIEFIPYHEVFQSNSTAKIELRYTFPSAEESESVLDASQCYSNQTYCSIGFTDSDVDLTNPTELVDESLRQICIFRKDRKLFWNYAKAYLQNCLMFEGQNALSISECSSSALGTANSETPNVNLLESELSECFLKLLGESPKVSDIPELAQQVKGNKYIFSLVPVMTVGTYIVRGEMEPIVLASSICDSFLDPPRKICSHLYEVVAEETKAKTDGKLTVEEKQEQSWKFKTFVYVSLAVVVAILIVALVLWLGKKTFVNDILPVFTANVDQSVYNYMKMKPAENDRSLQEIKPVRNAQANTSSSIQTESGFEI